jgi:hypothetical protein
MDADSNRLLMWDLPTRTLRIDRAPPRDYYRNVPNRPGYRSPPHPGLSFGPDSRWLVARSDADFSVDVIDLSPTGDRRVLLFSKPGADARRTVQDAMFHVVTPAADAGRIAYVGGSPRGPACPGGNRQRNK